MPEREHSGAGFQGSFLTHWTRFLSRGGTKSWKSSCLSFLYFTSSEANTHLDWCAARKRASVFQSIPHFLTPLFCHFYAHLEVLLLAKGQMWELAFAHMRVLFEALSVTPPEAYQ